MKGVQGQGDAPPLVLPIAERGQMDATLRSMKR